MRATNCSLKNTRPLNILFNFISFYVRHLHNLQKVICVIERSLLKLLSSERLILVICRYICISIYKGQINMLLLLMLHSLPTSGHSHNWRKEHTSWSNQWFVVTIKPFLNSFLYYLIEESWITTDENVRVICLFLVCLNIGWSLFKIPKI